MRYWKSIQKHCVLSLILEAKFSTISFKKLKSINWLVGINIIVFWTFNSCVYNLKQLLEKYVSSLYENLLPYNIWNIPMFFYGSNYPLVRSKLNEHCRVNGLFFYLNRWHNLDPILPYIIFWKQWIIYLQEAKQFLFFLRLDLERLVKDATFESNSLKLIQWLLKVSMLLKCLLQRYSLQHFFNSLCPLMIAWPPLYLPLSYIFNEGRAAPKID